jgi:hypothetical protein
MLKKADFVIISDDDDDSISRITTRQWATKSTPYVRL